MELIQLLTNIISVSGVCLGIKVASGPGMVLNGVSEWLLGKLGPFWHKPFFGCPACMCSFWGSITHLIINGFSAPGLMIISCVTCITINRVLWPLIEDLLNRYDA